MKCVYVLLVTMVNTVNKVGVSVLVGVYSNDCRGNSLVSSTM